MILCSASYAVLSVVAIQRVGLQGCELLSADLEVEDLLHGGGFEEMTLDNHSLAGHAAQDQSGLRSAETDNGTELRPGLLSLDGEPLGDSPCIELLAITTLWRQEGRPC